MKGINLEANRLERVKKTTCRQKQLRDERLNMIIAAHSLHKNGFCILQILSPDDTHRYSELLTQDMQEFPEYVTGHDLHKQVLGSFGALGNPSSFHCQTVRDLRVLVHNKVQFLMRTLKNHQGDTIPANFEQIIDRVAIRSKGSKQGGESWHRDIAPSASNDMVFGGWLNLDKPTGDRTHWQTFSCQAGTHREDSRTRVAGDKGFCILPDELQVKYNKLRQPPVFIKPGQLLVFNERLVHEIAKTTQKADIMLRLFMGWRLSDSSDPLTPNLDQLLHDQAVVPIKSGQLPRIYPKLYWTNHAFPKKEGAKSLQDLNDQFKPSVYVKKQMLSGKHKGKSLWVPHEPVGNKAHMTSLRKLSEVDETIIMYKPYTESEMKILKPNPLI